MTSETLTRLRDERARSRTGARAFGHTEGAKWVETADYCDLQNIAQWAENDLWPRKSEWFDAAKVISRLADDYLAYAIVDALGVDMNALFGPDERPSNWFMIGWIEAALEAFAEI